MSRKQIVFAHVVTSEFTLNFTIVLHIKETCLSVCLSVCLLINHTHTKWQRPQTDMYSESLPSKNGRGQSKKYELN